MSATLARRVAAAAGNLAKSKSPAMLNNPYQTKKVWPPDFEQMTLQEQLRFEKKYKRRIILASSRPRFTKGIKLTQYTLILGVLFYIFAFGEFEFWGQAYRPSEEIRKHVSTLFGSIDPEHRYDYSQTPATPTSKQQPK